MTQIHFDLWAMIIGASIVVKIVMSILVIASIYSWAIVLKKYGQLAEYRSNNQDFLNIYYSGDNLKDVMNKAKSLPFSPYKIIFISGYEELSKIKSCFGQDNAASLGIATHFQNYGMGVLERALSKGISVSNQKLDQLLTSLASIGSTAPFVGLFGTVWGIVNSFTGLAGGGATLDAVAPGIAEALVVTALGILVAIPAVWFFNHFANENRKMNLEMESFGQDFINLVERSLVIKQ